MKYFAFFHMKSVKSSVCFTPTACFCSDRSHFTCSLALFSWGKRDSSLKRPVTGFESGQTKKTQMETYAPSGVMSDFYRWKSEDFQSGHTMLLKMSSFPHKSETQSSRKVRLLHVKRKQQWTLLGSRMGGFLKQTIWTGSCAHVFQSPSQEKWQFTMENQPDWYQTFLSQFSILESGGIFYVFIHVYMHVHTHTHMLYVSTFLYPHGIDLHMLIEENSEFVLFPPRLPEREREREREREASVCCCTYLCTHWLLLGVSGPCSNPLSYPARAYLFHYFEYIRIHPYIKIYMYRNVTNRYIRCIHMHKYVLLHI